MDDKPVPEQPDTEDVFWLPSEPEVCDHHDWLILLLLIGVPIAFLIGLMVGLLF